MHTEFLSDDQCIRKSIKLLKHISQDQWQRKAKQQRRRSSLRHVECQFINIFLFLSHFIFPLSVFIPLWSAIPALSFSAKIAADLFLILQVLISKCGKQKIFLHIDNLQMVHDDGKNGQNTQNPVKKHQ